MGWCSVLIKRVSGGLPVSPEWRVERTGIDTLLPQFINHRDWSLMAPNTSADCRTKGYVIARSVAANGAEISSLTGAARQSLCGWVQVVNKTWRRRLELDVVISCVRRGQHWFLVDHIRRIGQTIGYRLWFDNEREIVTYWMFCYWDERTDGTRLRITLQMLRTLQLVDE